MPKAKSIARSIVRMIVFTVIIAVFNRLFLLLIMDGLISLLGWINSFNIVVKIVSLLLMLGLLMPFFGLVKIVGLLIKMPVDWIAKPNKITTALSYMLLAFCCIGDLWIYWSNVTNYSLVGIIVSLFISAIMIGTFVGLGMSDE